MHSCPFVQGHFTERYRRMHSLASGLVHRAFGTRDHESQALARSTIVLP